MEGSQAPAPQPPAEPKKNNMKIIAVIAAIAVIVIAIAAVVISGGLKGTSSGDGNDTVDWDPAVGDFYEYTMYMNGNEFVKLKYRVIEVTATNMTLNVTNTFGGVVSYKEETVPLGQSSDMMDQINDPPTGTTIQDKGMQSISTNWGSLYAHHYTMTLSSGGYDVTADLWVYKGMLIKMSTSAEGQSSSMVLTDTNIVDITG